MRWKQKKDLNLSRCRPPPGLLGFAPFLQACSSVKEIKVATDSPQSAHAISIFLFSKKTKRQGCVDLAATDSALVAPWQRPGQRGQSGGSAAGETPITKLFSLLIKQKEKGVLLTTRAVTHQGFDPASTQVQDRHYHRDARTNNGAQIRAIHERPHASSHRLDAHTGDNRHGIDARPNRPTHPLGFEGEGPRDAPQ